MRLRLCLLLLISGSSALLAQTAASSGAPSGNAVHIPGKDYTETVFDFFDLVKQMKYKAAADYLLDTNPAQVDNTAIHEALFASLSRITSTCGEFKRFSPIISKMQGNDIAYIYGVGIYEKQPVRYEFIFFRGDKNNWQLFSCSYSMEIAEELRSLAGIHVGPKIITAPAAAAAPSAAGK